MGAGPLGRPPAFRGYTTAVVGRRADRLCARGSAGIGNGLFRRGGYSFLQGCRGKRKGASGAQPAAASGRIRALFSAGRSPALHCVFRLRNGGAKGCREGTSVDLSHSKRPGSLRLAAAREPGRFQNSRPPSRPSCASRIQPRMPASVGSRNASAVQRRLPVSLRIVSSVVEQGQ